MANETHHDSDDKGSDRERRKAFFLLVGQTTCLALGIADDVAVPAHLRRGKASRPEPRKIREHLKDSECYEKQLWHPRQRRGEGSGLQAGASSTVLGEKQDRWLCWRAASQWWVAGAKLEPLGAAQVAVARRMLASRSQQRLWEGSLGREMSLSDGCLKGCLRENEMCL